MSNLKSLAARCAAAAIVAAVLLPVHCAGALAAGAGHRAGSAVLADGSGTDDFIWNVAPQPGPRPAPLPHA